jgi:hypothetical protein
MQYSFVAQYDKEKDNHMLALRSVAKPNHPDIPLYYISIYELTVCTPTAMPDHVNMWSTFRKDRIIAHTRLIKFLETRIQGTSKPNDEYITSGVYLVIR